jgi:hypothetical protein
MEGSPAAGYPREYGWHRLSAPRHLCGSSIQLSDATLLAIPASGIVEIADRKEHVGDQVLEDVFGRPILQCRSHHVRELLTLGFQHLPPGGPSGERPAQGRYPGEQFFDETLRKPVWWDGAGSWRDAQGERV